MSTRYGALRRGLVGAWCPSLRSGGYTLEDRSNSRANGTITGATWVAAPNGSAISFAGGQYVSCGTMGGLSFAWPFAACCWVRNLTSFTVDSSPLGKIDGSDSYKGWMLYLSQGKLNAYWNGGNRAVGVTLVVNDSKWKHLLIQWTGADAEVWINGVLDKRTATSTAPSAGASSVNIGRYPNGAQTFSITGQVDDCRIYNRSLTQSEIVMLASRRGIGLLPQRRRVNKLGSQFYTNVGGVWKTATPWIKVGGVWKQAAPALNVSGTWK